MTNIKYPCKTLNSHKRALVSAVVGRDRHTCQMCGATEEDVCPYDGRLVSLHVTTIIALTRGGKFEAGNLRTVCSTCVGGIEAIDARLRRTGWTHGVSRPTRIRLLTQFRRATIDDQKAVLDWILRKYKLRAVADD